MLFQFLTSQRADLIERCKVKVAQRPSHKATMSEPQHGIPLFLDQLIETLRLDQTSAGESRRVSGDAGGMPDWSEISTTAKRHGLELLKNGFTIDQVVHDYGDLCQAITDSAFEQGAAIEVDEFRTLNRCLDNAIADSVMEFAYQSECLIADKGLLALNERLGSLAHELRNLIHTATLAVMAIKAGNLGVTGATGAVLDRSLIGLRNLIDRSLAEVRVTAGLEPHRQLLSVAALIAEIRTSALLEAKSRGCVLTATTVDSGLAVEGDRDILSAAVGNLLQNAFKFTHSGTEVLLHAYAAGDRVRIDVEDRCGGLGHNYKEEMFRPFTQVASDRSGVGLGLSIVRRSVEAHQGTLSVRDLPGLGCIFTIDLPRHALSPS